MKVEGYHGTTLASAEALLNGSPWAPSTNRGDWLGFGSYFFQDGPGRAQFWAEEICRGTEHKPAVLRATIDLSDCLDLLDLDDFATMRSIARSVPSSMLPPQEELEVRNGRAKPPKLGAKLVMRNELDRFLVDFCVGQLEETRRITTVRSAFLWGGAMVKPSFLFDWSRVEIAVRDLTCP